MTILAINKMGGSLKNKGFKNPYAPCFKRYPTLVGFERPLRIY
jgi:3-deoxy-D-manno-octulosonic-acid transferase